MNVALTALLPGNTPPWRVPTGTPSSLHPQVISNRVPPGTPVSHHFDYYRYFHDIPQVLPSCSDEAPEPVRPAPAVPQGPPIILPAVPQGPPIILPAVPQGPPIILNESVQESVDRKTHREIKHVVALSRTPTQSTPKFSLFQVPVPPAMPMAQIPPTLPLPQPPCPVTLPPLMQQVPVITLPV